jgi:glycosyltransferase involved in cell wall biosynthesis
MTYQLQPPWNSGLKGYGRGLMHSLQTIDNMELDIIHDVNELCNVDRRYDYVHVILTGLQPFNQALRTFKHAKIFKHIVTPSIGFRNALSMKIYYGLKSRLEDRLVRCFSSEFVAKTYFMSGNLIVPPAIDTSFFMNSNSVPDSKIIAMLKGSTVKFGIENIRDRSSTLVFYSGPLTDDRFPYRKVLNAITNTRSKILIIGRPVNSDVGMEKINEIISYAKKLNIENRVAIAVKLLTEDEKISLLNFSDVVIQPFVQITPITVAVDPPIFLLEAMACGKPVITSSTHSFHSFIEKGHNGYTINWDNPTELTEALEGCQNKRLGSDARQTILKYFSYDSVAQRIFKMYNDYN